MKTISYKGISIHNFITSSGNEFCEFYDRKNKPILCRTLNFAKFYIDNESEYVREILLIDMLNPDTKRKYYKQILNR